MRGPAGNGRPHVRGCPVSSVETNRRLEVLGTFHLSEQNRPIIIDRPSCRRLLALLAVRGSQHRSVAAETLWPLLSDKRSLGNLRGVIWRLRQHENSLLGEDSGYISLRDVDIDFDEAMTWCHRALEGDAGPPPPGIDRDLLPGWVDTWLITEREDFHLLRVYALESAARTLLRAGRTGAACRVAAIAAGLDPLRESAVRLLIEISLHEDNIVAAIRQFERFAELLHTEIDAEPSSELTALVSHLVDVRNHAHPGARRHP